MNTLYEWSMKFWPASRLEGLQNVEMFERKGDFRFLRINLYGAFGDAMWSGLIEWRLGEGDPSPHFRLAIEDAARVPPYLALVEADRAKGRFNMSELAGGMVVLWEVMYASLLLGEPVPQSAREAAIVPPAERREPVVFRNAVMPPWDYHVYTLAETGRADADWDAFFRWLRPRRRPELREMVTTAAAYRKLIESARAGDAAAVERAIRKAEQRFADRCHAVGVRTWGDSGINDSIVDLRLACMIRQAEMLHPGITAGVDTPHRWRWS